MLHRLKSIFTSTIRRKASILLIIFASLGIIYSLILFSLYPPISLAATPTPAPLPKVFPSDFLMGTATAAHQIEGGNVFNDWYRWELVPGHIKNGDKSGLADDSWNRVTQDIALMKSLGANSYRFSIEWSRLEPKEGQFDEAAFAHYDDELNQLRAAGITPMVTLLHFTLPAWLADRGGLLASDFPDRFKIFSEEVAKRYGSKVDIWCTLNEPNVQMYNGYLDGTWPPGEKNQTDAVLAYTALLRAHAAGSTALHTYDPGSKVGVAMNLVYFEPQNSLLPTDWVATTTANELFNWAFYDSIALGRIKLNVLGLPTVDIPLPGLLGSADFLGVNYYTRNMVTLSPTSPALIQRIAGPGPKTDLGWEIYPEGMLKMLRTGYQRYHLPIYVTENGLADADGDQRGAFLRDHLNIVARALGENIPVKGYFHWSLLDNFEWAEGFTPRFGLYKVDYSTLDRLERPGVADYRDLANQILGK